MTSPEAPEELPAGNPGVLGAALGLASGPAAVYGAMWSDIGDPSWWVTTPLAILGGVALGAATWRLFKQPNDRPGLGFCALFAASVGLVAGGIVAFPFGGICGAAGGAGGGVVTAGAWRALEARELPLRAIASGGAGAVIGYLVALGVVA
ncbi:MAG: hypothetical protein VYE15_06310 [Myxococcota bacterium]|nr:hypothetical protein [Myxococcota bacterium]